MGKNPSSNNYNFNRKLKFIHLRNFDFGDCSKFRFDDETIVIFDNCYFSGSEVYFSGGSVQIINSSFDFMCKEVNLTLNGVGDFEFVSSTVNDGIVGPYLCFWGVDCGNFSVKGNNNYYKFKVYADNCYLENVKNLDVFSFNAKNLEIVNSDLVFAKKEVNFYDVYPYGNIDVKDLMLKNVHINVGDSILIINADNLGGSNYQFKFDYALALNNFYYFNNGNNNSIVWTSIKELSGKINFINVLKNICLKKEELINNRISDELSCYDEAIRRQDVIINNEILKLDILKGNFNQKEEELRNRLIKTKIKNL